MSVVVYMVTVSVQPQVLADWVRWMKADHIPDVLATGFFDSAKFYRVAEPSSPQPTFEIHYVTDSAERLSAYQRESAPALKKEHAERYGGSVSASRRILIEED